MVQKTFYGNGPDNLFFDAANWTPTGVPQNGDVASISMSTVLATGLLPDNLLITFGTRAGMGRYAHLTVQDATIPAGTTISELTTYDTYDGSLPSSLQFAGAVVNNGIILVTGGVQTIALPSGTTLTNNGTIAIDGAAPQISAVDANTSVLNAGLIRIVNTEHQLGQRVVLGPALTGQGSISISTFAALELGSAVGPQQLQFVGGPNAGSTIILDQPGAFNATIGNFVVGDTLSLANTASTSFTYKQTGAASGTLQILNGGTTPVASLGFAGVYSASSFAITAAGSSLSITTNVTDSSSGTTAAPVSTGIYRFFDKTDGTHFYTANTLERDRVQLSRPDLVQETNDFGAVLAPSSSTQAVYRFFDTVHGTHFFTASAAERDTTIATRSDLVFEPTATFLEHQAQQPGDVAVYRLFSTADGTHLYTGSANELHDLTTPNNVLFENGTASILAARSSAYRADLVSEGISFYAPAGNYG
ncbi:MAG: hypothetical protein ACRYG8_43730 [Janthinobacterium lividum]